VGRRARHVNGANSAIQAPQQFLQARAVSSTHAREFYAHAFVLVRITHHTEDACLALGQGKQQHDLGAHRNGRVRGYKDSARAEIADARNRARAVRLPCHPHTLGYGDACASAIVTRLRKRQSERSNLFPSAPIRERFTIRGSATILSNRGLDSARQIPDCKQSAGPLPRKPTASKLKDESRQHGSGNRQSSSEEGLKTSRLSRPCTGRQLARSPQLGNWDRAGQPPVDSGCAFPPIP